MTPAEWAEKYENSPTEEVPKVDTDSKKLYEDIGYLKSHVQHNTDSLNKLTVFVTEHMNSEEAKIKGLRKQLFFIFSLLLVLLAQSIPLKTLLSVIALF